MNLLKMKNVKIFSFCLLLFCFTACSGQSKKEEKSKKEGITKRPDQAELQKLWAKEKHRLEIDYCKLYYNGKQILLHDSISNLKRILGSNYKERKGRLYYQDVPVFVLAVRRYKGGVSIAEAEATNASYTTVPTSIQIMMGEVTKEESEQKKDNPDSYGFSIPGAKYVRINGVIISDDMMPDEINELMRENHKPVFNARRSWAYAKVYSSIGNPRMEACQPDPRLKQENLTNIEIKYQRESGGERKPSFMTSIVYEYTDDHAEIKP